MSSNLNLDLTSAKLHSIVPDAPIEECKNAIMKSSFNEALNYLKAKYSKKFIQERNISTLKELFPDTQEEKIRNTLSRADDDFDRAVEILYSDIPMLEERETHEEMNHIDKNINDNHVLNKKRKKKNEKKQLQTIDLRNVTSKLDNYSSGCFYYDNDNVQPNLQNEELSDSESYSVDVNEEEKMSFMSIDLHGFGANDAKEKIREAVVNAKSMNIGVIHFITGVGNHSQNGVPILKPLVLDICEGFNVKATVPSLNPGVVVCDLNKPVDK